MLMRQSTKKKRYSFEAYHMDREIIKADAFTLW